MRSARLWVLVLACVCFLGGTAAGILLGGSLRPQPAPSPPFADYQEQLADAFELSADRRRALRLVMNHYHRALEDAKSRQAEAMEGELVKLGLTYRSLIRNHVLPKSQVEKFDRLAGGHPGDSAFSAF